MAQELLEASHEVKVKAVSIISVQYTDSEAKE